MLQYLNIQHTYFVYERLKASLAVLFLFREKQNEIIAKQRESYF